MKISVDKGRCTECGACREACPYKPDSIAILSCRHCDAESAECRLSCQKGAIKRVGDILIITDACDGCMECSCPYGAIVFSSVLQRAVKCDMCSDYEAPLCIAVCPEHCISFREDKNPLGWFVSCDGQKEGVRPYVVGLPSLTTEEQKLVKSVLEIFAEKVEADGKITLQRVRRELTDFCEKHNIYMEKTQFEYLSKVILGSAASFCPLDPLLSDPDIEEIAVVGLNKPIYVYHRHEGWLETNCFFTSQEAVINIINKMARPLGRRITLKSPRLNAVLHDGSRVHASIPPLSSVELTIRKFRESPFTPQELVALGTFSSTAMAFLWFLFHADLNIIIAGNTASGKTTSLNSLFSFVPTTERILIAEETPEINIPHPHKVKLLANPELGIDMKELVYDSLRMRPDRVIVGEVRNPAELAALLETMMSGQARGSYATFHAHSAKELIMRMRAMGAIPTDIQSIDLVVVQRRMMLYNPKLCTKYEVRRVIEICEVSKGELTTIPIFKYDFSEGRLAKTVRDSALVNYILATTDLSIEEFEEELLLRERFLDYLKAGRKNFFETIKEIERFTNDKRYKDSVREIVEK
ncbi:MAG: ATPase, T2SS/T4P/T4SS family [Candidatus Micrarchaeia archaeon]